MRNMKRLKEKFVGLFLILSMIICLSFSTVLAVENDRIYGKDRISTSIEISKKGWQNGSEYVFIAQGYDFADALSVAPLAKKFNAPILLNGNIQLREDTINELKRLKPKKVFILGGEIVISKSVETQLKNININEIERIYGQTRYETALKINKKLGKSDALFITNGQSYADALSVSPIAAQKGIPILYTKNNEIPKEVNEYIKGNKISNVYVIGGDGVINDSVLKNIPNSERIFGKDRYETNREVLKKFSNDLKYENIYFVTGNDFPDALSISTLAADKKAPVILTNKNINSDVEKIINSNITSLSKFIAIGGPEVVPQNILDKFKMNFEIIKLSKDNERFGDEKKTRDIKSDILVTGNNVNIININLDGNLILDPGEKGTVNIKNVKAKNIIVKSGDVNSIELSNVKADKLDIETNKNVAVKLYDNSNIKSTEIKSSSILKNEKGSFGDIKVANTNEKSRTIQLIGEFKNEILVEDNAVINCENVQNIKINLKNSEKSVEIDGKVNKLDIIKGKNISVKGNIKTIKSENDSIINVKDKSNIEKIEALDKCKIKIENGAKVKLIEKSKDVSIEGKANKVVNKKENSSGGSTANPKSDEFSLIISNDGTEILNKNLKVDSKKSAMQYLKENADIKVSNGFIYQINNLKSKPLKNLSEDERKEGYLGADWFIYLNGKKTPVGANDVKVKAGDKLEFEYRRWDWHDLVADGEPISLTVEGIKSKIKQNEEMEILVTCVYRPVYDALIKIDGKEIATTNIDGEATIKISDEGNHEITVSKDSVEITKNIVVIKNNQGGNGNTSGEEPEKDTTIKLTSKNESFGDETKTKDIKENILVTGDNITLTNLNISGTLILDPGDKGTTNIKNVTVQNLIVKSGDVNSIKLNNVKVENLRVEANKNVAIKLFDNSIIKNTELKSSAILKNDTGSFGSVRISDTKKKSRSIKLIGDFKEEILVEGSVNLNCENANNVKVDLKDSKDIVEIKGNLALLNILKGKNLILDGKIDLIKSTNSAEVKINSKAEVNKIEALGQCKIKIEDGAKVKLVEKDKNVALEGNAEKVIDNELKPDTSQSAEFELAVLNNGTKMLSKTLKVDSKKSAMDYLNEVAKVKVDNGFIYEINGLKNVLIEKLSIEDRKKDVLGKDWFIYLNGEKTPVGAAGVFVKKGDKLTFEYRDWDWHDLYAPDYKGLPVLMLENYDDDEMSSGEEFEIGVSCVNKAVYNADVKVDGKLVGKTDLNGDFELSIEEPGKHIITVEKYGTSAKIEVIIKGETTKPEVPSKPESEEFELAVLNNGTKMLSKTLKVDSKKSAMDYLNEVAKVKVDNGFIYEINGLKNVLIEKLSIEDRKKDVLGKDWFIYLNGEKTPVGAAGVFVKKGDKLTFEYRDWDWHDLYAPDYKGLPVLMLENYDDDEMSSGEEFEIGVSCVNKAVYNADVKVDGKLVGKTDLNGDFELSIEEPGKHIITVEKYGTSAKIEVIIKEEILTTEEVDGKSLIIKRVEGNKIKFCIDEYKRDLNLPVTIKVLNEKGKYVYLDQSKTIDGKCEFNTVLDKGKYWGKCSVKGILINFKINIK
ncbi:cell wall-binding repeat-containing protein [Clostridium ihumii]|uniref:cell wall-binding repeat-containing protein n=1 Tax=Clostridium ihumii TaxID=1470356 RepID=UPI003D353BF6